MPLKAATVVHAAVAKIFLRYQACLCSSLPEESEPNFHRKDGSVRQLLDGGRPLLIIKSGSLLKISVAHRNNRGIMRPRRKPCCAALPGLRIAVAGLIGTRFKIIVAIK